MTFQRYYEDELAYLRQLGDAFGRANPEIAGLLSQEAMDPDVERLMEGFAFLTGRLRQRLDEELPELSQGLLALLWPHYLRPVPAMSILEFRPGTASIVTMPRGAAVESRPVEGTRCRFRTTAAIPMLPATVRAAGLELRPASALLTLDIEALNGASVETLSGQDLVFFLHGGRDARLGQRLLRTLLADLRSMTLVIDKRRIDLPADALRHAGFGADEAVLPWPENSFPGYRVLQEYLVFPERFLFVSLRLPVLDGARGNRLRLEFEIDKLPDLPPRLGPESFRLNCVPVINLAPATAEPFAPEPGRIDYRLVPAPPYGHGTVYAIENVRGLVQGSARQRQFHPFESMRHAMPGDAGAFFTTRLKPSTRGAGVEVWISLSEQAGQADADTIIAELTCTDGVLASQVPIGHIDQVAVGSPAALAFSNITAVTPEVPPPLHGDLLWRLVAGLARSLMPLEDLASLRALIASYDFRAFVDDQERRRLDLLLAALRQIDLQPMVTLVHGVPVRGRHLTLTVDEAGAGGPEGLFLLGAVLDQFLAVHAGINSCHRLSVTGAASKVAFGWPVRAPRGAAA